MKLWHVLLWSISLLAVLHYAVIPRLEQKVRADRALKSIGVLALVSALSVVRTVALLSALSAAILIGAVELMSLAGGGSSAVIGDSILRIQQLRESLHAFAPAWGAGVLVLLVVMLVVLARKSSKLTAQNVFQRRIDREIERLDTEFQEGKWPELPPSDEMKQLGELIEQGRAVLMHAGTGESAALSEEERAGLLHRLNSWMTLHYLLDRARRMEVRVDADELVPQPPKTVRGKVATFFLSEGMARGLAGSRRVVFLASILLLVPSLIFVQSGIASATLGERALRLEEMQVAASANEARAAWTKLKPGALPSPQVPDAEILDALAEHFEKEFENGESSTVHGLAVQPAVRATRTALGAVARQRILQTAARQAPDRIHVQRALEAPDTPAIAVEAFRRFEEASATSGPKTELGKRFRRDLEVVVASEPDRWARIKAGAQDAVASLQRPARVADMGRFAAGEVFGLALGETIDASTEFGKAATSLSAQYEPGTLRRMYQIRYDRFVVGLAEGRGLEGAARLAFVEDPRAPSFPRMRHVESPMEAAHGILKDQQFDDLLRNHPPGLKPLVGDVARVEKAGILMTELVTKLPRQQGADPPDALLSFDDLFPAQLGGEEKTPRAELRRRWERDGILPAGMASPPGADGPDRPTPTAGGIPPIRPDGPTHPGPGPHPSPRTHGGHTASLNSFQRARSFSGLRGFSRVGGVLIGQEPVAVAAEAEVRDLDWRAEGPMMWLDIVRRDGRRVSRGPFSRGIANQALVYAADGRPIMATMITAAPLAELQILAHPALVDTPLGCAAIEIDRYVDESTHDSPQRDAAAERVQAHGALYRRAWAARALANIRDLAGKVEDEREKAFLGQVASFAFRMSRTSLPASALQDSRPLADTQQSPLTVKREFFDSTLVASVQTCIPASSGDLFDACIGQNAKQTPGWFLPPPEFEVWSGVREQAFKVDPDFTFLQPSPEQLGPPGAWPLDFMLQISFTSPPHHAAAEAQNANDQNPWEFPGLHAHILESVSKLTSRGPKVNTLRTIWEFTVLQRFFRLLLDGHLGPAIPVEKLVRLAEDSAPFVKHQKTPRWNLRPGALEHRLAQQLQLLLPEVLREVHSTGHAEWMTRMGAAMRACVAAVSRARAPLTDKEWSEGCDFERLELTPDGRFVGASSVLTSPPRAVSVALAARELGIETAYARRLREVYGLNALDPKSQSAQCEPP